MNKAWKWILGISLGLNTVLILILAFSGEDVEPIPLSERTQQDIDKAVSISIGADAQELLNVMGNPIKRDAENDNEEWYYCRTGSNLDEFVQFSLVGGKVLKINNYTVSAIEANGLTGSCELFFKYGTSKKTPNNSSQQDAENTGASA